MDAHKRLLAILHIVYGSLQILFFVIVNLIFSLVLPIIESELGPEENEDLMIVKMVFHFIRAFFMVLIVIFPLPSIIGGLGQLGGKKWALPLLLISGCLSLLNIPIGTALGVYTFWVYFEDNKKAIPNDQN